MRPVSARPTVRSPWRQSGFTLIELSIAILIGLFLIGGLLTVTQDNRRAFANQSQLSELQDEERTAMTMITDIVQNAGYFPDPRVNTATAEFPVNALYPQFLAAGQYIAGSGAWGAADTLSVQFATKGAGADNILTCNGSNPGAGTYVNTFSIANGQLVCSVNNAAAMPLVGPVAGGAQGVAITQLSVRYGVNRGAAAPNNVDTYVDASQMAATDWGNVISVQVQLTFTNPLYTGPGRGQAPTITFTRIIDVMNAGGINIS